MEDSGDLEIKALAEKFLAIPKEIRLTGKDGYIGSAGGFDHSRPEIPINDGRIFLTTT